MNRVKLKEAEEKFIIRFPGGFSNPQMLELAKKHKVGKMKIIKRMILEKNLILWGFQDYIELLK